MSHEQLRLLQQMPVFGGLSEASLHFLMRLSPVVAVPSGEFYFHEHQPGGTMYVLEKGSVAVFKPYKSKGHLLAYLGRGDCFGEMEMIDPHPRAASVMAITECTAGQISNANLFSLYQKAPAQFTLIQMNMSREISRRLRRMDEEFFSYRMNTMPEDAFFQTRQEIIEQGLEKRKEAAS